MDAVESVLEHFGVRGMRWGVRRTRTPTGGGATKGALGAQISDDAARASATKKLISRHGVNAASNQDIRLLNERILLEKNFNKSMAQEKKPRSKGATIAFRILESVGEQQIKSLLNQSLDVPVTKGASKLGAGMAGKMFK